MKVMLVVPHLSGGGGERIVSDLSLSLQAGEIVLTLFEPKISYPYKGRLLSLDLPVDRSSLLTRTFGFLRRALAFRRLLRRERPDAVISFMGEANLINALTASRPILSVHNLAGLADVDRAEGKRLQTALARGLTRVLYRKATIVAVSEDIRRELVHRFRIPAERIVVIPNAVNIEQIQRDASEPLQCPWPADAFVVATAGRLTSAKGHWHLMRAFSESRKHAPMRLIILGNGELEQRLKLLAKQLGLENEILFLGWQANPHQWMARADLFALSSLTEGFGLVLLEAMACGLPIVTTNCPGPPAEIVAPNADRGNIRAPVFGDYGVVVPAFDGVMREAHSPLTSEERMLADVLVRMARQPDLREKYREASRQRVVAFSHESFVEKYQSLIRDSSSLK